MKNNERFLNIKKIVVQKTLLTFSLYCFLYTSSYLVLAFFVKTIVTSYYWDAFDSVYLLLKILESNQIIISVILLFAGYLFILYRVLLKNYYYFEALLEAMESIDDHKVDIIEIPYSELKDVEYLVNQTKRSVQSNTRAAKEAEQRKNDLIVYLAHDLKTPLTSIIGYITLLKEEPQISLEMSQRYLGITLDKAERLEDLINEFFEITRFNLTKQELEIRSVNFSRMLEQLTFEFKPMLEQRELTCTLETPKDITLLCDAPKMQRALDNLLRNAINYSFEKTNIEITVKQKDDVLHIRFSNHGHTIPKEKLERIFEQFYRLDYARGTNSGGAGLGLAITKDIIEVHQGTLIASSENENIVFDITLPMMS